MSFEEAVISSCSPVLVGIKPANLFSVKTDNYPNLEEEIKTLNDIFMHNGIMLHQVNRCENYALIFIFRPSLLRQYIFEKSVSQFLADNGYDMDSSLQDVLESLFDKIICEKDFPHEIGLFLGYPLEDIKGFVKHQGKNCKMFGYWKVYGDEKKAKTLFSEYDRCKAKLTLLYKQGTSFNQLCVAS